ncbi:ketol-acid reductoisomerase [Alteromonas sp. ASW11-130]|uniref:ketol-acid reductoisomerase n=1 Tax=Alteromonas sp. ASW11-130 TaxID=3015775 RepID=UPI0022427EC7|nr:ketol-acid reductoisomerase [Alteromonas sp. ASW11-130]MCW8093353.1 ketol-acid reductoisomerase [Alteromonas sp. ASW11-130]
MANYFNSLSLREQLTQLKQCRFMARGEFAQGAACLKDKRIVIVGCGAQGLNQGLNMRDSGLHISYALRQSAIDEKRDSYTRAKENDFEVGTYQQLIPEADVVYNLTPDKQHANVVETVMPLMKQGATLAYSHGFNIVEQGQQIRSDITVVMCAPKCPGTEVREEYKRGFGVPTLIAVHPENDPQNQGWEIAKALASATGGDRAGVLASSFVAEVKSDLMGEQTILCGMQQTAAILAYEKMTSEGIDAGYAAALIQQGLEQITEALKLGGITHMMDRLTNPDKLATVTLADQLKHVLRPLFEQHQDNILSGKFSADMIRDWENNDKNLLTWREETLSTGFEQAPSYTGQIDKQEFFDNGLFLVAMIKAGVELAFEVMVEAGMLPESAYYESLHETPLIANTIARKRLYEMNVVISDTAEYGNYLFCQQAIPLLKKEVMPSIDLTLIGKGKSLSSNNVDNQKLLRANFAIRNHLIESVGNSLREHMLTMRSIA